MTTRFPLSFCCSVSVTQPRFAGEGLIAVESTHPSLHGTPRCTRDNPIIIASCNVKSTRANRGMPEFPN